VLTGVPAEELGGGVARVRDPCAAVLVTQVHAVVVSVAAPAHGDAEAVRTTLELIHMTAPWRTRGCEDRYT